MNWVGRTIYRNQPSFEGREGIAKAVRHHFKFIRSDAHAHIFHLLMELIKELKLEDYKVDSYSGTCFKIGELGFYPKVGNLHIDAPDQLIPAIKTVADNIFVSTEVTKEYPEDHDSTLIIELRPFGWH